MRLCNGADIDVVDSTTSCSPDLRQLKSDVVAPKIADSEWPRPAATPSPYAPGPAPCFGCKPSNRALRVRPQPVCYPSTQIAVDRHPTVRHLPVLVFAPVKKTPQQVVRRPAKSRSSFTATSAIMVSYRRQSSEYSFWTDATRQTGGLAWSIHLGQRAPMHFVDIPMLREFARLDHFAPAP
jgi:hypothetical protein